MGIKSAQAKSIRNKALLVGLCTFAVYTALFVVVATQFGSDLYQKAGYKVAALTAPWHYVTEEEYTNLYEEASYAMQDEVDVFVAQNPAYDAENETSSGSDDASSASSDAKSSFDATGGSSDAVSSVGADVDIYSDEYLSQVDEMQSAELTPSLSVGDASYEDTAFWRGRGLFAWRDLSVYHRFMEAEQGAIVACYFFGLIILLLLLPPRLIGQIDKLAMAVKGLFADKDAPIKLPKSLESARSELLDIQNRELHNEQAAQQAEQRKNELVAYLAHDIRTPLTSVIGYLDILRSSPDLPEKEREKFAAIAYEKAEQLDVLMEEFFEITRYNLQSIPVEREQVDLNLFCQQVAESIYPQAQGKMLQVEVEAPEQVQVFIDPAKMARACGNILRNAIAYADPSSTINIQASCQNGALELRISDHGKEISPEHLDTIFEKFFREDVARTANKGGAGLGLAIAKEIVEAHGGSIAATSDRGLTTFTISLPNAS